MDRAGCSYTVWLARGYGRKFFYALLPVPRARERGAHRVLRLGLLVTLGRHGGGWQAVQWGGRLVDPMYGRPCDNEHYANFPECIRGRERPTADIEFAHRVGAMVHISNVAHRVGNITLEWDNAAERFKDNAAANALLKRDYREPYTVPEQV